MGVELHVHLPGCPVDRTCEGIEVTDGDTAAPQQRRELWEASQQPSAGIASAAFSATDPCITLERIRSDAANARTVLRIAVRSILRTVVTVCGCR